MRIPIRGSLRDYAPITRDETTTFYLAHCFPQKFRSPKWPPEIDFISPTFVNVYAQAAQAESDKLDQICGPGYRKSLEFLIKDYLIHKGMDADKAKATALGNCIEHHVSDANIKECAKRATWLGNDETHYVRVWTEHDVNDLKTLIRLTVNWIHNELLTEKYKKGMKK